ncbi:MAG: pfkB family carbohydrate kinase [bacterium ADurb.Bin429]|nr:MAG: pfkB family carbohydrate kinase [bacterium ADurb.Bin429]
MPLLQGERLASLLALVRETGVFISLDTTPIPDDTSLRAMLAPALPHAHLLKVNIEEAAQITGCFSGLHARAQAARRDIETIVTHEEIYRIGAALLAMGVPMVVITLGPNGACLFTGSTDVLRATPLLADAPADWADQRIFVPAYQVDGPVNAAGAGDAFTAALLAGLCRGIPSLAQLARVAHATAALQVDLTRFACRFEDIIILLPTLRPRIPENPHLAEKGVN